MPLQVFFPRAIYEQLDSAVVGVTPPGMCFLMASHYGVPRTSAFSMLFRNEAGLDSTLRNDTDRFTFCQSKKRKHAWSVLIYFFPALATCHECKAVRALQRTGQSGSSNFHVGSAIFCLSFSLSLYLLRQSLKESWSQRKIDLSGPWNIVCPKGLEGPDEQGYMKVF